MHHRTYQLMEKANQQRAAASSQQTSPGMMVNPWPLRPHFTQHQGGDMATEGKPMKIRDCVAYLRVSSDLQTEGFGFDRQLEKIEAYATTHHYCRTYFIIVGHFLLRSF